MTATRGEADGLAAARTLPDDYARLGGPSSDGVLRLVARRWGDRSEGDRRQLAQILLLLLAPLNEPGATVTEDLRDECESTVARWVRTTVPVPDAPPAAAPGTPPSKTAGRRLIRLVWADSPTDAGQAMARVTLEGPGRGSFAASVPCPAELNDLLYGGAQAATQALNQALAQRSVSITVSEVTTFDAFGNTGVIVSVAVTDTSGTWNAVGTCADIGSQPVRAAALAVLNAINRRLGIG